jgi:hypothetical protein
MGAENLSKYLTRNSILNSHPERPAASICNGKSSDIGMGLVENGRTGNVVILELQPHTSHVLQPVDHNVFSHL